MDEKIKQEYIKWYKIAVNYVQDQEILPNLSDTEILKDLLSRENWLMFVKDTQDNKKDAVNYPEPNIYLIIERNLLMIGLTFNNAPSVDKLKNILSNQSEIERAAIVKHLITLDNSYKTIVSRKIREYRGPPPTYDEVEAMQTNKLNDEKFKKIIELCVKIREEGREKRKTATHKSYYEGPTVNLAYAEIPKDVEAFKKVISDILPIYKLCVSIKTGKEVEDEELIAKIKQIDGWDWSIIDDREDLSRDLKRKFDIDITPAKLKKIGRKLGLE